MDINLNLGGGQNWSQEGWENLERNNGYDVEIKLLIPYETDTVSRIYASHILEHMQVESARKLIKDCYRALKPGGILRLVLPDCETFARMWITDGPIMDIYPYRRLFPNATNCFLEMGGNKEDFTAESNIGHYFFWDKYSLTWLLAVAGFTNIIWSSYGNSFDNLMKKPAELGPDEMPISGFDNHIVKPISVYIEAFK